MKQGTQSWCTGTTQRDCTGEVGGSGWGTCVHPWRIHVDIWQNQYNILKLKYKINKKKESRSKKYIYKIKKNKLKKKKKNKKEKCARAEPGGAWFKVSYNIVLLK